MTYDLLEFLWIFFWNYLLVILNYILKWGFTKGTSSFVKAWYLSQKQEVTLSSFNYTDFCGGDSFSCKAEKLHLR